MVIAPPMYDIITYFRPDGLSVNLSDPPFMLVGHDGFGISEFDDTTVDPPGGHGSYWYATRMNAKVVSIEFTCDDPEVAARQNTRAFIVDLFNPLLGPGRLRIEQVNGTTRELVCKLAESLSMPTDDFVGAGGANYTVRFKSHGIPAFYNPTPVVVELSHDTTPGNFSFPWSFPRTFGQSGYFGTATIVNAGNIETHIQFDMTGPLSSPIFTNLTTNQKLSMPGLVVYEGGLLHINTDPENTEVIVNGNDAMQYVDDAEFWGLERGPNTIQFDIGSTTSATLGTIQYLTRYIGQ